jgi:tetratricopeptide (TPR) repeat protein
LFILARLVFGALLLWQQRDPPPDIAAAHQAELAGDFSGAEAIYTRLVTARQDPALYQRLGLVRHMQNKYDAAAGAFTAAIKLDPTLWTSHLFLGIDLYRLNRFDEAQNQLKISDRQHPGEQETAFWLGATALARHDFLNGFIRLETFLQRDPKNAEVLRMLAEAYADHGTALLNEVGNRYPDSPAGLIVQAKALEFEGAYAAALDAYRSALRLDPGRPELKEAIARVEALRKQTHQPAANN